MEEERGAGKNRRCTWCGGLATIRNGTVRGRQRYFCKGRVGRLRLLPMPGVGLTQVVKERRDGRLVKVTVRQVIGQVEGRRRTVDVERRNGVLRDRLACLTRKAHAFAKATETWEVAVGLAVFEGNWLHPLRALRERAFDVAQAFGSDVFDREVLDSEARTRRAQTESAQARRALSGLEQASEEGCQYRQRTPAMVIGLTDHIWSWREFLSTPRLHYQRE